MLKKLIATTALSTLQFAAPAMADPAAMIGLAWNFGGGSEPELGLTGKILSSNRPEEIVGAAGITYFFGSGNVGFDAGLGYTFDSSALTLTYDLLNRRPQFGLGWANIDSVC